MPSRENTARASNMFGHFDIRESIGQGGMGIVYRALDTSLGREIALKVLKDDLRNSKHIAARFQREGEAFATLNHPNIVHIYSVGRVGRIPYIAMEFVDGDVLSRKMKRERRIPWEEALSIAEQVSQALACAHENGIIHRDIKPGNILLDKDGTAFVTDFGIAKVLTAEVQLTVDGSRLGTPEYMSPERVQNQEVTASSDIYSLGIVLFQMLTGQLPFKAATPIDLIRMIVTEPPRRLRELEPEIPEDVERLVSYMLEKQPKDRPADAVTLAKLIGRVRDGKPLVEDDSGLSAAMGDLRDSMSTPTPYTDGEHIRGHGPRAWMRRLNRRVRKVVPAWAMPWLAAVLVALVSGMAGYAVSSQTQMARALEAVKDTPQRIANWQQSPVVAAFSEETDGVLLASAQLPGFASSDLAWRADGALLVNLKGVEKTDREGQWGVVAIAPESRGGRLEEGPALASVVSESRGLLPGFVQDGQERVARALKLAPHGPNELNAMTPHANRRFVAYRNPNDPTVAYVSRMGLEAPGWTMTAEPVSLAGRVTELLADGNGQSCLVHLALEGAGARIVHLTAREDDSLSLEIVYEGSGSVIQGAWNAATNQLLVTDHATKEGRVWQIDTSTKQRDDTGLTAASAAWAGGEGLVLVRADRTGKRQLYRAASLADDDPEQLTFLTAGIGPRAAVSPSGNWIAATSPGGAQPVVVFVELSSGF